MFHKKLWILGMAAAIALSAWRRSQAAIFAGHQIEIAWTGSTAFGPVENDGSGPAENTYTAPMNPQVYFGTAPYDSATDMITSVQDMRITLANGNIGIPPPQWFEYLDVNNTLPDFIAMKFSVNTALTTDASFNIASDLQVEQHGVAIKCPPGSNGGLVVVINVAVPEPATLGMMVVGLPLLCRRQRPRSRGT